MSTKKKKIKKENTKTRFILQAQNPLTEELYATIKERGFSIITQCFFFEDRLQMIKMRGRKHGEFP